jgi:hypothetical protein
MYEKTLEITSRVVKGGIRKSYGLGRSGHSQEGSSQKTRNASPTTWEIPPGTVYAE